MLEFNVSEKRKKVWAVEFDLLRKFMAIAEKYQLKYWAMGGTLLGAMRHEGMIPWDDDIDISMPREDYEKFLKVAPGELEEGIFLQTAYSDKGYYYFHAKLRDSRTTAIRRPNWKTGQTFNQGIFIDIIPLDEVPDEGVKEYLAGIVTRHSRLKNAKYWYKERKTSFNLKRFIKWWRDKALVALAGGGVSYYRKFEKDLAELKGQARWGVIGELPHARWTWKKEWFNETKLAKFGDLEIPVPGGYEEVLKATYGDWKVPQKVGSEHGELFYDTEKSYKEYLGRYEEFKGEENFIL